MLVTVVVLLLGVVSFGLCQDECPPLFLNDFSSRPRCTSDERSLSVYLDQNDICPVICYTRRAFGGGGFGRLMPKIKYVCKTGLTASRIPNLLKYTCESDSMPVVPNIVATSTFQVSRETSVVIPAPVATSVTSLTPSPVTVASSCSPLVADDDAPSCDSSFRSETGFVESDCLCKAKCYTRRAIYGSPYGPKTFHVRYTCCNGQEAVRAYPRTSNYSRKCV